MTQTPEDIAAKIIMQGIHLELTPALQNAIREKFSVLFRHHDRILRVHVRLTHEQTRGRQHLYSANGQVEISGPDLVASVHGDDAHSVIDGLVQKLDEQLRQRHELRKDKRNHPHGVEFAADLPKAGSE